MTTNILFFVENEDNIKDAILVAKDSKFNSEELEKAVRESLSIILDIEDCGFDDEDFYTEEYFENIIASISSGLPAEWHSYDFYWEEITEI